MKIFLAGIVLFFTCPSSFAQILKKYPVGNSGCYIYSYCDSKYKMDYSDDSSKVFTGECTLGELSYGVICIQLLHPIADINVAEDLMISYVDYLKGSFEITKASGYGKGHRLKEMENTRGILDYWEDKETDKWKIKAWTDGHYIGFLYAYSKKELSEARVNAFLDSFRLPGMK